MVFSDDEENEIITDELNDFIDNSDQPWEDVSFYRQLDILNINNYPKFPNQTTNRIDAIFEVNLPYYGKEDIQPELYAPEERDLVSFDKFTSFKKFTNLEKF